MRVAGIILAGGSSRRLGRPKQLLPLAGRPILQHVIDLAYGSELAEVVVVLGHEADAIASELTLGPGVRVVVNERHTSGQASSLITGVGALGAEVDAALVLLGDQPEVRSDAIEAVVADAQLSEAPVIRAAYGGVPGHPVVVRRSIWPEVAGLDGDAGLRSLLGRRPDLAGVVEVGGSPPPDIDTAEDYAALLARWTDPGPA